jgi:hypothetical protein
MRLISGRNCRRRPPAAFLVWSGAFHMVTPVLPTYARADLAFESGEGVWLVATTGERYLDFGSGVAVNALGHAHPRLVEALTAQAARLWHTSNLYRIPNQERLAEMPRRRILRRHGVLRQFRRRGDGVLHQDGAQVPRLEGQSRALRADHLRGRLPRPYPATLAAGGQESTSTASARGSTASARCRSAISPR